MLDVSINVISKSGTTTEPAIAFRIFKEFLEKVEKEKLEELVFQDPNYFYNILPFTYVLEVSDKWISYDIGEDYAFFNTLRMILAGHEIIDEEIAGVNIEILYELVEIMKNAEYGALFFGLGLTQSTTKQGNVDVLIQLIEDLNKYSKWSMLPMRGFFNVNGFNMALTTETGYPYGVDYSRGYPRYMVGETTTIDLLNRREPDFFMAVAADPGVQFPGYTIKHLVDIPVVQVDTHWGPYTELADIVLPSTRVGVETKGTAYRMDSIPLYMKKVIEKPENCHSDQWILSQIYNRIEKLKQENGDN